MSQGQGKGPSKTFTHSDGCIAIHPNLGTYLGSNNHMPRPGAYCFDNFLIPDYRHTGVAKTTGVAVKFIRA